MYPPTWEPEIAKIVLNLIEKKKRDSDVRPTMVGVVGMPGSGKTTSSIILANVLEERYEVPCTILPMDGYHYSIAKLKSMDNSEDLIYRRGAPETFDANALRNDLNKIRYGDDDEVLIPGFNHEIGDPKPNEHKFERRSAQDVVIVEGLYLLLDDALFGWNGIRELFDVSIYINSDVEECVRRLKIRNQCIPGYSPEEIALRCEKVDRVNAMIARTTKSSADYCVDSFDHKIIYKKDTINNYKNKCD